MIVLSGVCLLLSYFLKLYSANGNIFKLSQFLQLHYLSFFHGSLFLSLALIHYFSVEFFYNCMVSGRHLKGLEASLALHATEDTRARPRTSMSEQQHHIDRPNPGVTACPRSVDWKLFSTPTSIVDFLTQSSLAGSIISIFRNYLQHFP